MPVQEAIISNPHVARQAPDLAAKLRAVLDRRRSSDGGGSRGYEQGFAGSAFELHAFNSDGLQKRSKVYPVLNSTPSFLKPSHSGSWELC